MSFFGMVLKLFCFNLFTFHLFHLLTRRNSFLISFRIFDVQQRTITGFRDFYTHDFLVTYYKLISDHFQVRLTLRDDVFFGADLQQFEIPVDNVQFVETIRGNHHLIIGVLDCFGLDPDVGYEVRWDFLEFFSFPKQLSSPLVPCSIIFTRGDLIIVPSGELRYNTTIEHLLSRRCAN